MTSTGKPVCWTLTNESLGAAMVGVSCGNCKHWLEHSDIAVTGECRVIAGGNWSPTRERPAVIEGDAYPGSAVPTRLFTRHDFGCTLFEPKE